MGLTYTSYFGLARISDVGPEVKGWTATYLNPEITALLIRNISQHHHSGTTPIYYPGYNIAAPATPTYVTLSAATPTGGVLSPGTAVGVRISYLDTLGLETDAAPEASVVLASAPARANSPTLANPYATPSTSCIDGGTYVYTVTKANSGGETTISGVATVDVPFTSDGTTYALGVSFDPISLYNDGTTKLNLYRATGLNANFVLLKSFTDTLVAEYIDDNSIEDTEQAPPISNTFDKNKAVWIDWSQLAHPATAQSLRIYVTQQPTSYNVNNLLAEWPISDIATPLPAGEYYYGSETLKYGWPKDFSQIPSSPDKLVLGTEATGAPILTTAQDFRGYGAKNFVFATGLALATPIDGSAYVETSTATPQFRVRLGGNYQTLVAAGASYSHATNEPGGHGSQAIFHSVAPGGPSVYSVLNAISTPVTPFRIQAQTIVAATPTETNYSTTSSAGVPLPEMETFTAPLVPDFAGQWVEMSFSGGFYVDPGAAPAATASFQMEINGSLVEGAPTFRSFTSVATPCHAPIQIIYATPCSSPIKVRMYWMTSTGTLTSIGPRRFLMVKDLF